MRQRAWAQQVLSNWLTPAFDVPKREEEFIAKRFSNSERSAQYMTLVMALIIASGFGMAPDLPRKIRLTWLLLGSVGIFASRAYTSYIPDQARGHWLYCHASTIIYAVTASLAKLASPDTIVPPTLSYAVQFVAIVVLRVHHYQLLPRVITMAALLLNNLQLSRQDTALVVFFGDMLGFILQKELRDSYYGLRERAGSAADSADLTTRSHATKRHTCGAGSLLNDDTAAFKLHEEPLFLGSMLGSGGMSVVYEGRWLGMTVAVKVAREGSQGSKSGSAQALVTEVEALRTLRHPCICSYIGVVMLHDGVHALVLEHLSSGSLSDLLHQDRRGPNCPSSIVPSDSMLCKILHQVAVGIAYLHAHRFMHRDVKSSNVLLTADFNAKVSDFGISKAIQACEHVEVPDTPSTDASGSAGQGQHTLGVGTLRYMAPELLATRSCAAGLQPRVRTSHYGPSCDVYSFGILLWEVTHRSLPFAGMLPHEAAQAALRDERPPIQLAPELAGYRTIIERSWLREPSMRPLMAHVVADIRELRDVTQSLHVLLYDPGSCGGAHRHTGQHVFVDGQPEDDVDHHTAKLGADCGDIIYFESMERSNRSLLC